MKLVQKLRVLAVLFLLAASGSAGVLLLRQQSCIHQSWLLGLMSFLLGTVSLVLLHMSTLHPADSHSVNSLVSQYTLALLVRTLGRYYFTPKLLRQLNNPMEETEKLLLKILKTNGDTSYSRDHGLTAIKDLAEFRKHHPLTSYSDYLSYIERVKKGENGVLTTAPVAFFAMTSGTTGNSKAYPCSSGVAKTIWPIALGWFGLHPEVVDLRRQFDFRLFSKPRFSDAGVPMGSGSTFTWKPSKNNVVPASHLMQITQEKPAYYVQAIFALRDADIGAIECFSSHLALGFFKFMEKHWGKLCDNILMGEISGDMEVPHDLLEELNAELVPMPERALYLRQCMKDGEVGLAKRVWPQLQRVMMAKAGGFAHSANILVNTYLKDVALFALALGASEGLYAVNIESDITLDRYVFTPHLSVLEFIPEEKVDDADPPTVLLDELCSGRNYEVVVTTLEGLYRYRLGDVVRVVGFNGNVPTLEFLYRIGQVLSVAMEKTPENLLCDSITDLPYRWSRADADCGEYSVDYFTTVESAVLEQVTGERELSLKYVIFLEVSQHGSTVLLTESQKSEVDKSLCDRHDAYKVYREKGSIVQARVIQVALGTFGKLQNAMFQGNQHMQFKMPRVLRRSEFLQLLLDNEVPAAENKREPCDGTNNQVGITENRGPCDGVNNQGPSATENREYCDGTNNQATENREPCDGTSKQATGTDNREPCDGTNNQGTENREPCDGINNPATTENREPCDGTNNQATENREPCDGTNNQVATVENTEPCDGTIETGESCENANNQVSG